MNSSLPLSSFLLPLLLLLLLPAAGTAQNSNVYGEYIGSNFKGVKFSDVPINPGVRFNFILAFAIDYTSTASPSPTNGQFNVFWQTAALTPADVSSIKQAHPNVRVAVSIGGDTVGGSPAYFNPTTVDTWVSNAVSSLTRIIKQYGLDGLDVDYEHFSADPATFAACIGRLVTALKRSGAISFASIAPFDDGQVQSHYQALWAQYAGVIDYVNFQFYAYGSGTTVAQFLGYYQTQSANYNGGKVLASFSTGGGGGLSPANGFFNACRTLQSQGKLPGIFAFSADDSKANGFPYETQAQALLAG